MLLKKKEAYVYGIANTGVCPNIIWGQIRKDKNCFIIFRMRHSLRMSQQRDSIFSFEDDAKLNGCLG